MLYEVITVILLSGGLDSATCLAIARAKGRECHAISFDYGQRHRGELARARRIARALGAVSHRVVKLDLADLFLGEDTVLLTGAPAWDNYVLIVEARRNAILETFPVFKGNGFDIEGFRAAIAERSKTGAVRVLLNFPQNPSYNFV